MENGGDYGTDYSPRFGAQCPECGYFHKSHHSAKVLPWQGRTRTRYHKCLVCGRNFKSIETDFILDDEAPFHNPA